MKITTSAPGKLMLFGEHAVVYHRPCMVTAVSSRVHIKVKQTAGRFQIEAPQVKDARFVEETVEIFKEKYKTGNGLTIKTQSDFESLYGFGSSSAVTVALLYALAHLYRLNLTKEEVFKLGYQVTLNVQGVGSGFDIAAATFGKTLYFVTGGKVIEPLNIKTLPLVVGYSGVKADTPKIVKSLKLKVKSEKSKYIKIFDEIKMIVEKARKTLLREDYPTLGKLMNDNHKLLQKLGVSTKKLDKMCQAALGAGAWGAKLSGAGGGDCMIAVVSPPKRNQVEKAITEAGGEIITVRNNEEGVRIER